MEKDIIYKEYEEYYPTLLKCMHRLHMYIYKLLYEESMPVLASRIKSVQSLSYKIEHEKLELKTILENRDTIGLRVICLSSSKVKDVVKLIETNLNSIEIKDTQTRLGEDRFGYSSTHIIIRLNENDSENIKESPEEDYKELWVEIQVRTYAQHIFADLSHKYSYKSSKYIPPEIKRPLFRIAALSEVADNEINQFEEARLKYIHDYKPTDDNAINIESLKIYFSTRFEDFRNIGPQEDYEGIVKDLDHFGIKTIRDLNLLVDKHFSEFREIELRRLDYLKQRLGPKIKSYEGLVKNNYIYSYVGTIRGILELEFKEVWDKYYVDALQKPTFEKIRKMLGQVDE